MDPTEEKEGSQQLYCLEAVRFGDWGDSWVSLGTLFKAVSPFAFLVLSPL